MRLLGKTTALTLLLLIGCASCLAQGPDGGQFTEFREKHKYTFQLTQTARHIGDIDKNPNYALKPDQAKRVLAVLKPLRSKPKLTQDEAKAAIKALKPIFTIDQLNAMARIKPERRGGMQRPGGGPPGGRPRMMDTKAMEGFNPFHVDTKAKDEWAKRRAQRWNRLFSTMEQRAKQSGKPAKKGKG